MPRTPTREPAATPTKELAKINTVLASAARLTKDNMARPKNSGGSTEWQNEAWYFYDTVGEFRFGANWKAQALSRCRLIIETMSDEGTWVPEDDLTCPEWQALQLMFGGDSGQSQALAAMGLHLDVPGETYLVGETLDELGNPDPNGDDTWTVYSNEEFKPKGSTGAEWELDRGDGKKRTIVEGTEPGQAWVIRIWRSHPRKWVEADSPARASIPILRQIENLTKKIAAEVDSRLAGAGVLFVPTEMTFSGAAGTTTQQGQVNTEGEDDPAPLPQVDEQAQQKAADKFLTDLIEAMTLPIANRDHPSSVVPVVVQAPAMYLDKVKHVSFSKPLDKETLETRTEEIRRLALTADMPAEVMLGLGDVNHWTAWQLDESAIKMHVEPNAEVITSGLTSQWLTTAVKALGAIRNPKRRVGCDTSDLRLRPDRSEQAQWLYDHLELDGESLRRELGIEGDAPDEAEVKDALLRRLASEGLATPEVVVWAISALFSGGTPGPIPLATPAEVTQGEGNRKAIEQGGGDNPAGPPADDGPPAPAAPATAASAAEAAVIAAAELHVHRAVERARNRARQRGKRQGAPSDEQLAADLRGAWEGVPRTCELLGLDQEWFTERLDTYARGLLQTGEDHQPDVLARVLGS